jgi:hypothetical protein
MEKKNHFCSGLSKKKNKVILYKTLLHDLIEKIVEIKKMDFGIKFVDNLYYFYNFILQVREWVLFFKNIYYRLYENMHFN